MGKIEEEQAIQKFLEEVLGKQEKLGIPGNGYGYMQVKKGQSQEREFLGQYDFLRKTFSETVKVQGISELYDPNGALRFINYGDTQMVYVLDANGKKWSVLVTQPSMGCGIGKKEYDNLQRLAELGGDVVVKPEYYFTDGRRELYVAPYIYQARCVASQEIGYGVYVPEPYYRFEPFNDAVSSTVNRCIIANLVSLYDEENGVGLGKCKIGGGDFILDREWDTSSHDVDATLKHMKLIAARKMIPMSMDDYLQQLLIEFSERTYYSRIEEADPNVKINCKNRMPMEMEDIGEGIELGMQLRKVRK